MPFAVKIQWQPEAAIESLEARDRQQVQAALDRLGEGRFVGALKVDKTNERVDAPDFHILRVNDRLLLLFTIDHARLEVIVHDLISREFAQRYG